MKFELQNELLLINMFEQDACLQVINTSMKDVELIMEYLYIFQIITRLKY